MWKYLREGEGSDTWRRIGFVWPLICVESSERQYVRDILRVFSVSSGISFVFEVIDVSDVPEHQNSAPSSPRRKGTCDAELVQPFGFNKSQRLRHQSSDKAIELTCEGFRKLTEPVIGSGHQC